MVGRQRYCAGRADFGGVSPTVPTEAPVILGPAAAWPTGRWPGSLAQKEMPFLDEKPYTPIMPIAICFAELISLRLLSAWGHVCPSRE